MSEDFVSDERRAVIEAEITRLEAIARGGDRPAAIVAVAPDRGNRILGTSEGFVRLALASLKAAKGEAQEFKKSDWVGCEELDWQIGGLEPDSAADVYIQKKSRSRFGNAIGYFIVVVFLAVFVVGLITTFNLLFRAGHGVSR